jgi:hypothetical protein
MPKRADLTDEVSLPSLEAMLAGTLALMTGYSQALQADQAPGSRVLMGVKIGKNLELLGHHPCVTDAFRRVMEGLQLRWTQMSACTELAAPAGNSANDSGAGRSHREPVQGPDLRLAVAAPPRLQ